jgi:sugar O-acyltransferase (sialic acid O-acetyltransferase NeuD family)
MRPKILLIGAGGHGRVVLDLLLQAREYQVAGIIDLKERIGDKVLGVPVIGTDKDLPVLFKKGIKHCFISVGSVGEAGLRVKLYEVARRSGFAFPNLIHPSACISRRALFGEGNYIGPGVIINVNAVIGNQCIINSGAIVEHDCRISDFAHISPGVYISGGVSVGEQSHIGIGSSIIQNLRIGARTIIGAGSVVTKNIRGSVIAYGNPCKEIKNV